MDTHVWQRRQPVAMTQHSEVAEMLLWDGGANHESGSNCLQPTTVCTPRAFALVQARPGNGRRTNETWPAHAGPAAACAEEEAAEEVKARGRALAAAQQQRRQAGFASTGNGWCRWPLALAPNFAASVTPFRTHGPSRACPAASARRHSPSLELAAAGKATAGCARVSPLMERDASISCGRSGVPSVSYVCSR